MIAFFPSRIVALQIGSFQVHWYGIMYLLSFILAYVLLPILQRYRKLILTRDQWSTILSWGIIGVIVGGRLGYILFYEPVYYFQHPEKILAVWEGGMASHGGFIGVSLAMWYVMRKIKIPAGSLADTIVVPVAIGLAFGRLGNFINQELYGYVTTLPWGISIPGVEGLRHPTQIYEMIGDLATAALCFVHLRISQQPPYGKTCALFLMSYGVVRYLVEMVRVPDHSVVHIGSMMLTRGQLYTIPIFLVGLGLWLWLSRTKNITPSKATIAR